MLEQAGFRKCPGKGSHTNWVHPLYAGKVTVAGKDAADAKPYLEKEVIRAIQEVKRREKNGEP
jgi:predicted RNA binding protein YcfA (HicA-like mRNA interferase family)